MRDRSMSRQYSIAEARDQLARLVRKAEAGDPVTIAHRGRPVAVLLSEREFARLSGGAPGYWQAYETFRQAAPEGAFVDLDVFHGLRARDTGRDSEL
jgi:prevent-host-death family protein